MEFDDNELNIFDEIMEVVKRHPDFKRYELCMESSLKLPGLEIYPNRRKIYRDRREVSLTVKEFDILCYLAANRGKVMTYAQIYQQVWGDYVQAIAWNCFRKKNCFKYYIDTVLFMAGLYFLWKKEMRILSSSAV